MIHSLFDSPEKRRRQILQRVEDDLRQGDGAGLSFAYRVVAPFGETGLVVTAAGITGEAQVVPAWLAAPNVKVYREVPSRHPPHFEVLISGVGDDDLDGLLFAHDAAAAAGAVRRWLEFHRPASAAPSVPIGEGELRPLRALVRARDGLFTTEEQARAEELRRAGHLLEAWETVGLVAALDPERHPAALTPQSAAVLAEDLRHLAPDLLLRHFPRQEDGRLPLGETVLLAAYESPASPGRDRQHWLVARAPQVRRTPQRVTLDLCAPIGENHAHRWDEARWMWDSRRRDASPEERWGVANLPVHLMGLDGRPEHLAQLEEEQRRTPDDLGTRAARCILLQDEGRLMDALELYGVELAPEVLRLLAGQSLTPVGEWDTESWRKATEDALRGCAPWLFERTLRAEQARLEAWRAAKRGRPRKDARLRLFALPHQRQQCKASLVLAAREPNGSGPRLEIEFTASNARLAETAWRRPVEIDLVRFGIG